MRHIFEGYRWMWGAVRRWRGGALGVAGLAAALLLFGGPRTVPTHFELGVSADGHVFFDGRTMALPELEGALQGLTFQTAGVEVEADAAMRIVQRVQTILTDHGVTFTRVEMVQSID